MSNRILHSLGIKYHTDKAYYHNYCDFYDMVLSPIKSIATQVLEVGINEGSSLLMWHDYFQNAIIYGIDITFEYINKPLDTFSRIKCGNADTSNSQTVVDLLKSWDNPIFDFIIDDGSHIVSHQKNSIETLWKTLKPGGIYIIEDLHTNILENFYNHPHLNPTIISKYLDLPESCHD